MNTGNRRFALPGGPLAHAALAALLLLNVSCTRTHRAANSAVFRAGQQFGRVEAVSMQGRRTHIEPARAHKHMLITVVDPDNVVSAGMADQIFELPRLKPEPGGLIVLSTGNFERTKAFAAQHRIDGFTYALSPQTPAPIRARFGTNPMVLSLSPSGTVSQVCATPVDCVKH